MTPPDRNPAVPHELLLGQAGFLRRLARDLVRDPQAADDAVQDTWVAALEHPPRHDGNVRAWLGTVLKNLVARRAQADVRRMHHEARIAREGAGPSAPNASGDTVRFVTDAVLALEEPYQSTILARYFEDLSPSEIAQRQSVPVATVKSRLHRALELLRVRLTRDGGDSWRPALLAWTVPADFGKGVLAVTLKTKLALGCAAGLLAWAALRIWSAPTTPPIRLGPLELADRLSSEPSAGRPTLSGTVAGERVREPAQAAGQQPPDRDASGAEQETFVFGSVIGDRDTGPERPQLDWVLFTDLNGQRYSADVRPDASYEIRKLPFGRFWILAHASGWRTLEETFELQAGQLHVQKDLHLQPAPVLSVFVHAPDGRNLEDVVMERLHRPDPRMGPAAIPRLIPVATREPPGAWILEVVGSANNPFGIGQFMQYDQIAEHRAEGSIGVLILDEELPACASLVYCHAVLCTERVERGATKVDFVVPGDVLELNLSTLRMQVVDASTHESLPSAWMELDIDHGGARAGAQGEILARKCEPGRFHLVVGADGHELQMRSVELPPGRTLDLGTVALEREIELPFRVLDCEGAPCEARFALGVLDPETLALEIDERRAFGSDEQGLLTLPPLSRRLYVLRTVNQDASSDPEPGMTKSVSGNILIDLRAGVLPTQRDLRLVRASRLLLRTQGPTRGGPGFRVIDTQGVELVAEVFFGNAPRPLSLPKGSYRVELLDRSGSVLSARSVVLEAEPVTLELAR